MPIVSFVARQRDLKELVGDQVAGAEVMSLGDTLQLMAGRFTRITLEDRNLPLVAKERLLKPRMPKQNSSSDPSSMNSAKKFGPRC